MTTWEKCLIALAVGSAVLLSTSPLWADPQRHDQSDPSHWYDMECCSLKDCRALEPHEMTVAADGTGWHVRLGHIDTIVPWRDERIRVRKGGHDDPRHHACMSEGDFEAGDLLCIYPHLGGT